MRGFAVKSHARFRTPGAFRNRNDKAPGNLVRQRRMFFETLEPRQMLTVVPIEGTPFWDFPGNYLPTQEYQSASSAGFLSGPAAGDPLTVALNYLQQNAAAYGLTPNDLTHFNVTNQYTSTRPRGHSHLPGADVKRTARRRCDYQHQCDGGRADFDRRRSFVPGLSQLPQDVPRNPPRPSGVCFRGCGGHHARGHSDCLSAERAEPAYGHQRPSVSHDPIEVELHYVPSRFGGVDLAWEIIARPPDMTNWFDVSIAASGSRQGSVIRVADWTANASYNVFPTSVQDPVFGDRSIVVNPSNPTASPFGWHDGNGTPAPDFTDTRGNNVFAQEDRSGLGFFLGLPGGFRPQGGPSLNFNFPINFALNPNSYESAAITNLFFWNNIAHDVSFNHGFTEPAGNFQFFNYTGTGLANDPVMANNQELFDFGFLNNAFMATPPDGQRPNMGMFLFSLSLSNWATAQSAPGRLAGRLDYRARVLARHFQPSDRRTGQRQCPASPAKRRHGGRLERLVCPGAYGQGQPEQEHAAGNWAVGQQRGFLRGGHTPLPVQL